MTSTENTDNVEWPIVLLEKCFDDWGATLVSGLDELQALYQPDSADAVLMLDSRLHRCVPTYRVDPQDQKTKYAGVVRAAGGVDALVGPLRGAIVNLARLDFRRRMSGYPVENWVEHADIDELVGMVMALRL